MKHKNDPICIQNKPTIQHYASHLLSRRFCSQMFLCLCLVITPLLLVVSGVNVTQKYIRNTICTHQWRWNYYDFWDILEREMMPCYENIDRLTSIENIKSLGLFAFFVVFRFNTFTLTCVIFVTRTQVK